MTDQPLPSPEKIGDELARRGFRFWAPRRFHILDKFGRDQLLQLNPVQLALDDIEEEMMRRRGEVRIYCLKGRQGGITTGQQAKSLHLVTTTKGVTALTLAHDREATDKIFSKITRYAIDNFPEGKLPTMGERQTRELEFPDLTSVFYTGTAGAKRTGRGLTLRRLHGSEFAFWDAPKTTLNSVTGALVPQQSAVVLETTASGFDSEAHRFWREARDGGNSYRAVFFPWWDCDAANYRRALREPTELGKLEEDEKLLIKRYKLSLQQIAWRRDKIKDMGRDEFFQEYPEDDESCWLAPGGLYFPLEGLKQLLLRAPEPIDRDMGGELEIYDEPKGERVIIGADTAEGVDQDSSTFTARAFPSWRLLRAYRSPTVQPKEFAGILDQVGRQLGCAYLVVEKNMHGITVLRHLRDDHKYPVGQIYHRETLDKSQPDVSGRIGWATTAESIPIMLGAGRELFKASIAGDAGVPPAAVMRDAFGVRRGENGKFKLSGKDLLVAEMLAWIGRSAPNHMGFFDFLQQQAAKAKEPGSA
jgi:hypothetical protein